MTPPLAVLTGLLALLASQSRPAPSPHQALAALLDLPSAAARAAAAEQLAARTDVSLAQWLAAASTVPLRPDTPEPIDARTWRHRVTLWVMAAERQAEIFVRLPAGPPVAGPRPLLFVGHEARSDGRQALATWAPLADRYGLVVAALTEPYEAYRQEGWAYKDDAQQEVYEALRAVRRRYDIDEDRIVIAGVARGGHMAWDIALRRPDLFSGLIAANGSPRLGNILGENNMRFLEALAPVPVRALEWGAREATQVGSQNRALAVLRRFGAQDARAITAADAAAALAAPEARWAEFFAARRRAPTTVVRVPELGSVPLPTHFGRCHWVEVVRIDPKVELPWQPKVRAEQWRALDEQGRRDYVDDWLRDQSPRVQVKRVAPGRFEVVDRGIHGLRLLLTPDMVEPGGGVTVAWRGATLRKVTTPSAAVLLREFAERFDRTFLPTLVVALP